MVKHIFEEVRLYGSKSGICQICGKKAVRTQKFYQTINPFNKSADGSIKTHSVITEELKLLLDAWKAQPVLHAKCEESY